MLSDLQIFSLVILGILGLTGSIMNSSIAAVYFRDFRKRIVLRACDKVLVTMSVTNVALQCLLMSDGILSCLKLQKLLLKKPYLLHIFIFYLLISINLWNTAWLSFCYCVRLVTFSNQLFNQLKIKLSSLIPMLLVGSVVVSVAVNTPYFFTIAFQSPQNVSDDFTNTMYYNSLPYNLSIGCIGPFFLTLICIGFSVTVLLRHIWKINVFGTQCDRGKKLVKAAQTMVLLMFINSTFYIINTVYAILKAWDSWQETVYLLNCSYPLAQAIIIILGNPKLLATWRRERQQTQ
ncbi:taste receptor type 2 member 40-like [Bombina bombina]|uniref:taste receptor type 2 member 40-like n=1 Tax=Bombina bombina TaxID=8345 RepID=UPI00235AD1CD|nr:taste receptor type 2 member 40-like [Bombina bombina]